AANLDCGIWFEVPDVLVGGGAEQEAEDARTRPAETVAARGGRHRGTAAQQLGQRQAGGPQAADAQPLAAGPPFTRAHAAAADREHGRRTLAVSGPAAIQFAREGAVGQGD